MLSNILFTSFQTYWKNTSFSVARWANFFFRVPVFILFLLIFFQGVSYSQTGFPSIINVAGKTTALGNYHFDWSVGESAAITTMEYGNLLVTNGLLQYQVENQPEANLVANFLSDEIRVYPNPVKNILGINILHANKGKHQIELLDAKGIMIKEVQLNYTGMGALENWNLSGLSAGQYYLNIRQTDVVTGRLVKKGAYRIVKVN
jgi:hypothetical protein